MMPGPVGRLGERGAAGLIRRTDEAFVLDTRVLGEADLIVVLLTEQHGGVRAVARSARSSRRRFGGVLEPMTRVHAVWHELDGRELHRLDEVEARRSFAQMQSDPLRQAACAVMSEVCGAFSQEGQADPEEFRLLGAVLEALEQGQSPLSLLRYFEYWTLRVHGLLPDFDICVACGRPLPGGRSVRAAPGRGLLCRTCPREERETRLGAADRSYLQQLRRLPPARIAEAGRPGPAVETLLRGALESFAERSFRSYRHFRAQQAVAPDGEPR